MRAVLTSTTLALAGVFLAHLVMAQKLPDAGDQLAQCQALVRVSQDLIAQTEHMAAALLVRAEKAEREVAELRAKVTEQPKPE